MGGRGQLEQKLDYVFDEPRLLTEALTHRSAGGRHNERLEFLGDSILNFVVAAALFERFPEATEGELSRLRASLVKGEHLADIANRLGLSEHVILGSGELKSGGFRRTSILADALEAILGAVFLDGGFAPARKLILSIYSAAIEGLPDAAALKDPKTRLQEKMQALKRPLPTYEVVEISGDAHEQRFRVTCRVAGLDSPAIGSGRSRRRAEQAAAELALRRLEGRH